MAGYRDRSNFDPYGTPTYGRPLRPFNWVQWAGVFCMAVGLGIDLLYFTGRLGWSPRAIGNPVFALPGLMLGVALINSRREGAIDPAPELAAARRRWLIITIALCAVIIGAAIVIDLQGA